MARIKGWKKVTDLTYVCEGYPNIYVQLEQLDCAYIYGQKTQTG